MSTLGLYIHTCMCVYTVCIGGEMGSRVGRKETGTKKLPDGAIKQN